MGRKYLVMSFIGVGTLGRYSLVVPLEVCEGLVRMLELFLMGIVRPALSRRGDLMGLSAGGRFVAGVIGLLEWGPDSLGLLGVAVSRDTVLLTAKGIVFDDGAVLALLGEWFGRVW